MQYNYGASELSAKSQLPLGGALAPRRNATAIACCLAVPVSLFAVVSGVLSSSAHYDSPGLCWLVVWLAAAAVLVSCYLAFNVVRMRLSRKPGRDPTWYVLLALTLITAWASGTFIGSVNYWSNVRPTKDLGLLSVYPDVDPSKTNGRQFMDAGRVTFTEGTRLDLTRTMGFKNLEEYCVAPITIGNTTMATYDFWAVGLNCCSGNAGDFHCGEYNNPSAHSGLRLMRDDQRPFYRLAVQQAEATFGITSQHPLFFYWMQDPVAEIDAYHRDARRYYFFGLLAFLCFQLFAVVATVAVFTQR